MNAAFQVQETVINEEEQFKSIMKGKLIIKAKKTNSIKGWLKVLELQVADNRLEFIEQIHHRVIFEQEIWLIQLQYQFSKPQCSQHTINLLILALQDGHYEQIARRISNKIIEVKDNTLIYRDKFIIIVMEKLIAQFKNKKVLSYIYNKFREYWTYKGKVQKIRQCYLNQISCHHEDCDIVYDEYQIWQSDDSQREKHIPKIYLQALQKWQYQQQQYDNNVYSECNIGKTLAIIENQIHNFQVIKYINLLNKLPNDYQRIWYLRRMALGRKECIDEYLQLLQLMNTDEQIVKQTYQIMIIYSQQYQQKYIYYLIRRINKHIRKPQNQQYNCKWSQRVQQFRQQISKLIHKNKLTPKVTLKHKHKFYMIWIEAQKALIRDKQTIIKLYETILLQQPLMEFYTQYSKYLLSIGDVTAAKIVLQRSCQKFHYVYNNIKEYQNFLGIYGNIEEIRNFNGLKMAEKGFFHSQVLQGFGTNQKNDCIQQLQCQNENSLKNKEQITNQTKFLQKMMENNQRKKIHTDNGSTIFIKGIPITMTQNDILKILKYANNIKQIRLIKKNNIQYDYCYVDYDSQQYASKQVEENKTNYKIQISKPPNSYNENKTLFLCALPKETTQQQIKTLFPQSITDIRLIVQKDRSYAYIDFQTEQQRNKTYQQIKNQKLMIKDKKVILQLCDSDRNKIKTYSKVIFMKNVAFKATENDIKNFFQGKQITNISIPKNQKNKSKGFAYVEFKKFKDFQFALDLKVGQIYERQFQIYRSNRDITEQKHQHIKPQQTKSIEDKFNNKNNNFINNEKYSKKPLQSLDKKTNRPKQQKDNYVHTNFNSKDHSSLNQKKINHRQQKDNYVHTNFNSKDHSLNQKKINHRSADKASEDNGTPKDNSFSVKYLNDCKFQCRFISEDPSFSYLSHFSLYCSICPPPSSASPFIAFTLLAPFTQLTFLPLLLPFSGCYPNLQVPLKMHLRHNTSLEIVGQAQFTQKVIYYFSYSMLQSTHRQPA